MSYYPGNVDPLSTAPARLSHLGILRPRVTTMSVVNHLRCRCFFDRTFVLSASDPPLCLLHMSVLLDLVQRCLEFGKEDNLLFASFGCLKTLQC